MESYIDDTYLILNDTLLSMKNDQKILVVPSEVNGHRIRIIGSGFYTGDSVTDIIISEGIEEINTEAFCKLEGITKRVVLPESLRKINADCFDTYRGVNLAEFDLMRKLSVGDYEKIRSSSILLNDGESRLVTPEHATLPEFSEIYSGFGSYGIPRILDAKMNALFIIENIYPQYAEDKPKEKIFKGQAAIINTEQGHIKEFRERCLKKYVGRERPNINDPKSENAHDRIMQNENYMKPSALIITEYNERNVRVDGDKVHVTFHLTLGSAFFVDLLKVAYAGKDYFIYREKYIKINNCDYLPEDYLNLIVDSEGKRPEKDVMDAVATKYKLACMIS
ncbi:MAG: hypothetical protein K6C35_03130 [Eubacterium sp.]|nr:hypothetical protein [Eubacterium sp.]